MKRVSAYINAFGRRSIPLNWSERHPGKRYDTGRCTVARRIYNDQVRAKENNQIRTFRGDWENFIPVIVPKHYID